MKLITLVMGTALILLGLYLYGRLNRYTLVPIGGASYAAWRMDNVSGEMYLCAVGSKGAVCIKAK